MKIIQIDSEELPIGELPPNCFFEGASCEKVNVIKSIKNKKGDNISTKKGRIARVIRRNKRRREEARLRNAKIL